jgi:hypothetical protein
MPVQNRQSLLSALFFRAVIHALFGDQLRQTTNTRSKSP